MSWQNLRPQSSDRRARARGMPSALRGHAEGESSDGRSRK